MSWRQSRGRTGLEIALVLAGFAVALTAALELLRRRRTKGARMADAKQIVRRLIEEPWTGNMAVIDEFIGSGYTGHDPSAPEPISGPDGVRTQLQQYIDGFPDGRITVDDQVAEGNKVASRWTARGTQTGEVAGIAPTGKQVTVSGLTISRLEDGMVVEEWTTWDTLGMLVQLGAILAPAKA